MGSLGDIEFGKPVAQSNTVNGSAELEPRNRQTIFQ